MLSNISKSVPGNIKLNNVCNAVAKPLMTIFTNNVMSILAAKHNLKPDPVHITAKIKRKHKRNEPIGETTAITMVETINRESHDSQSYPEQIRTTLDHISNLPLTPIITFALTQSEHSGHPPSDEPSPFNYMLLPPISEYHLLPHSASSTQIKSNQIASIYNTSRLNQWGSPPR